MTRSEQLVLDLAAAFPALEPLLAEHRADNEGELLPYLLLADVARWAQASQASDPTSVGGVVDRLEHEFSTAEPVEKDLIALGFVESIPFPPAGAALLLRLGPRLTQVASELGLLSAE